MRTLKQVQAVALKHMQAGTLELGEKVTSQSVSSYLDGALFEKEVVRVLKNRPMPFVPSDKIKNTGESFSAELLGLPLVAVRDPQGQAKVFLNVCRHRGAKLENLVCPFHGWSYDLNGAVSEITERQNCFPKSSKNSFHLKEVCAYETGGMIWVILDPAESGPPMENYFTQLADDLGDLGFTPAHALPEKSFVANFNWKIGIEAFLEVYHFTHAHAPYLSELQFANLSLADGENENSRIVVPLKMPSEDSKILSWAQVMYFIFPATFLLFYEDHVALISLQAEAIDKTKFRYIPLVPKASSLRDETIQKKVDFLEVIISQDVAILEDIQKGLASKANSHFIFTRLEQELSKFHQNIKSCM